jgi:hypothetical protein
MRGTPEQRRPVTQADLDEINAGLAREGIEPVRQPAPAAHIDVSIHDDTMASTPQRAAATTNQPISPALEHPVAPQQHKPPAVEQRAAENEQYLDRSIDPEKLFIPLVRFPRLNRVIYAGRYCFAARASRNTAKGFAPPCQSRHRGGG